LFNASAGRFAPFGISQHSKPVSLQESFGLRLSPVCPQAVDELKIQGVSAGLQGQQRKPMVLLLADRLKRDVCGWAW
jgi:hypothetical protein